MSARAVGLLMFAGLLCGPAGGAQAPAPAAVAPIPAARYAAADELLRTMGLEEQMIGGATAMVDAQISQNAALAPYREVMLDWARTFMTWDAVAPKLTTLYASRFDENELRQLTEFYRSPIGRKALVELPALMQEGATLGMALATEHLPQLEERIRDRTRELEAAKATNAATAAGGVSAGAAASADDRAASQATLSTLRTAGVAMFAWITDAADTAKPGSAPPRRGEPARYVWSDCPAISHADLARLLGGGDHTYLADLPRLDGWGHELEFCLERESVSSDYYLAGIRSPGRDGRFETGGYGAEPFPPTEVDRDLVWLDGIFLSWPSSDAK